LNKNFPGAVSDARAGFVFGGAGETSRRCLMAALAWQAISGWGSGRMSGHGTSVPIGSTVISGLKSRAPATTNINLLIRLQIFRSTRLTN